MVYPRTPGAAPAVRLSLVACDGRPGFDRRVWQTLSQSEYEETMANTILFIDDEPDILELVSIRLRMAGHRTVLAPSGEDALKSFFTELWSQRLGPCVAR